MGFNPNNKWLIFLTTLAFVTLYSLSYFSLRLRFLMCVHVISPFTHSYCLVHLNLLLSDSENNRNGHKKLSFLDLTGKPMFFKDNPKTIHKDCNTKCTEIHSIIRYRMYKM